MQRGTMAAGGYNSQLVGQQQRRPSQPAPTSLDGAGGRDAAGLRQRLPHLHLVPLREAAQAPGASHACQQAVGEEVRRRYWESSGQRRRARRHALHAGWR